MATKMEPRKQLTGVPTVIPPMPVYTEATQPFKDFQNIVQEFPWKLVIRKGYILPGQKFDDPVDVDLVFAQIEKSVVAKDPRIPKQQLQQVTEMIARGNKQMAIQTAMQWPSYFTQHYACQEPQKLPNVNLDLAVQNKGIILSKKDPASSTLISVTSCGFDDLVVGQVLPESVVMQLMDKEYKLTFANKQGAYVLKNIVEYIGQLKLLSTMAVALFNHTTETGMSFQKGDLIQILDRDTTNGWINGQFQGTNGWFPNELVEILIDPPQLDTNGKVVYRAAALGKLKKLEERNKRYGIKSEPTTSPAAMSSPTAINYGGTGSGTSSPTSATAPESPLSQSLSTSGFGALTVPPSKTGEKQMSFLEFAQSHFALEPQKTGILGTLSRTGSATMRMKKNETEQLWKEVLQRIKWASQPIKSPLTKLADVSDTRLALESHQAVMQYMGDMPTKKTRYELVFMLISLGMQKSSLRDELYSQLLKQTTNNKSPKDDSLKRGWDLLIMFCAFVPTSIDIEPYIKGHLQTAAQQKREFWDSAELALDRLKKNKASPRLTPPSAEELETFESRGRHMFKVQFPEGSLRSFLLESHTTVKDITKNICDRYAIMNTDAYGIYVCLEPGDFPIIPMIPNDKIADMLNMADGILQKLSVGKNEFTGHKLVFQRKLWSPDAVNPSDPANGLMFHQIVSYFFGSTIFTDLELSKLFRENIAQIVALLLHIRRVDMKDSKRVQNFIPALVRSMYEKNEWEPVLERCVTQLGDMSPEQAINSFLEKVKGFKLYGNSYFKTTSSNDSRFPSGCILAIGHDGIKIVDKNERHILDTIAFENIVNFRYDENEFALRAATSTKKFLLRFETRQGFVIWDLIQSYISGLQSKNAVTII